MRKKNMPEIHKFMTAMPHTIGDDISIQEAQSVMREYGIRHLPVKHGGKLVGILSDRDVKLANSFEHDSDLNVEEVMSQEVYTVLPSTPLDEVVEKMATQKIGSAIVQQDNGKVVGIFTAVDALIAFNDVLDRFYKHISEEALKKLWS